MKLKLSKEYPYTNFYNGFFRFFVYLFLAFMVLGGVVMAFSGGKNSMYGFVMIASAFLSVVPIMVMLEMSVAIVKTELNTRETSNHSGEVGLTTKALNHEKEVA